MADTVRRFDDETNPRSNVRVGRRLGAMMGAAGVNDRPLEELIGGLISYETIRQTKLGNRGLTQEEAYYIAQAIGEYMVPEVGDPVEWLLSGRITPYNPGAKPDSRSRSNVVDLTRKRLEKEQRDSRPIDRNRGHLQPVIA